MKYVRIGKGRPWVQLVDHSDFLHPQPRRYEVAGYYGWVLEDFWKELDEYQSFSMIFPAKEALDVANAYLTVGEDADRRASVIGDYTAKYPWASKLKELVSRAGGMIWQFDMFTGPNPNRVPVEWVEHPVPADSLYGLILKASEMPLAVSAPKKHAQIRSFVELGKPTLRKWRWWDVMLSDYLLPPVASFMNLITIRRYRQEVAAIEEWQNRK